MDEKQSKSFENILNNLFEDKDKVKNMLDNFYKDHNISRFEESDIYKLYSDMIDVVKKPVSDIKRKIIDYPFTNVYVFGSNKQFVNFDIICPGVNKEQLEVTVEMDDSRTFLCIKGTPWYNTNAMNPAENNIKIEMLVGTPFDKKYDITPYNIEINTISSEYKDGILTVTLSRKPEEDKTQNLKIKIK